MRREMGREERRASRRGGGDAIIEVGNG
uniref:Uncharacterized protein n=1 Tax=Arundo donax TaxID=35708 RepID=A0A0A9FX94_ARUDO